VRACINVRLLVHDGVHQIAPKLVEAERLPHAAHELEHVLGLWQRLGHALVLPGAALRPRRQGRALGGDAEAAEPLVGQEPRREGHQRDVDVAERARPRRSRATRPARPPAP
jgi:hypothetical protein